MNSIMSSVSYIYRCARIGGASGKLFAAWLSLVVLFSVSTLSLPVVLLLPFASNGSSVLNQQYVLAGAALLLSVFSRTGGRLLGRLIAEMASCGFRMQICRAVLSSRPLDRGVATGEWSSLVAGDVSQAKKLVVEAMSRGALGIVVAIGAVLALLLTSPLILLLGTVTLLIIGVGMRPLQARLARLSLQLQVDDANVTSAIGSASRCREGIVGNARVHQYTVLSDELAKTSLNTASRLYRLEARVEPLAAAFLYGVLITAMGYIAFGEGNGLESLDSVWGTFLWVIVALPSLLDVFTAAGSISSSRGALQRIMEWDSNQNRGAGELSSLSAGDEIASQGTVPPELWIAGPSGDGKRLLHSGSGIVAVVGPSGAGKSTALRSIVGIETHLLPLLSLRSSAEGSASGSTSAVAFVPQQIELTDGSLRGLYRDYFGIDLDTVASATLAELFGKLLLGSPSEFAREGGLASASGGELARICLTGAILSGARVVVLDEPSGGLDQESSSALGRVLLELAVDRLVILASHDRPLAGLANITVNLALPVLECVDSSLESAGVDE